MKATRVLESCLYSTDLDAAQEFYTRVLGLSVHARDPKRHLFMRCGRRGMVLIFNPDETEKHFPGLAVGTHGARGEGHLAFGINESEIVPWREHLKSVGVPIEQEIRWPNGSTSIYFRDPAGNSLELATPKLWGLEEEKDER